MIKRLIIIVVFILLLAGGYLVYKHFFSAEAVAALAAKQEEARKIEEARNKQLELFGKDEAAIEHWTTLNVKPLEGYFVTKTNYNVMMGARRGGIGFSEVYIVKDNVLRELDLNGSIPAGLESKVKLATVKDQSFFDKAMIGNKISMNDANTYAK